MKVSTKAAFLLLAIAVASCSGFAVRDSDVIEGEYMILLKENAPSSSLGEITEGVEILLEQQMGEFTYLHVEMGPESVMGFENHPLVEVFEQDRMVSMETDPIDVEVMTEDANEAAETEESAEDQCRTQSPDSRIYGIVRTSYRGQPNYASDSYIYGLTGRGVDIYVIDSGIDTSHEDFSARANHGFVSREWEGEGVEDLNGHGTNCASLAGGQQYGVAKDANLINVKVLGANNRGSWSGIAAGVNYVANRVRDERREGRTPRAVISMSIYGGSSSSTLYQACANAVNQRIPVIVCAGNAAQDTRRHYPAAFDNTIAVGATDINDQFASFSNWGNLVDISAPGVRTYAAWSSDSSRCSTTPPGSCYAYSSGTSMATPIVSGVVARYMEGLSEWEMAWLTAEDVREMLIGTSSNGYIRYSNGNQQTTPNRMAFRGCALQDQEVDEQGNKDAEE